MFIDIVPCQPLGAALSCRLKQMRIAIENVCYEVSGTAILHDINYGSDAKRIGIIGRNGSGKSTLSRLLCGIENPTQGKIFIDGIDVVKDRKSALRTVGILFQNPDQQLIFPTVLEELCFGLTQLGLSKSNAIDKAHKKLAEFKKEHWYDKPVQSLSQGQKKLLCLMAILVMEPEVILLDEPLAALDIPTQRQLFDVFDRIEQTLVYVTHDLSPIEDYDEIIWLEKGRIVECGKPRTLLPKFRAEMDRIEVL